MRGYGTLFPFGMFPEGGGDVDGYGKCFGADDLIRCFNSVYHVRK